MAIHRQRRIRAELSGAESGLTIVSADDNGLPLAFRWRRQLCSAWRKAREAIGEDAQQRYAQELHERIQSLENWSAEMLQQFPVDADSWTPDMPRFSKKEEPLAPPEQDDRQGGSQSDTRPYRPKF